MKGYTPFAQKVDYLAKTYHLPKQGVIQFLELYEDVDNGVSDFKNTYQFIGKANPKLLLSELTKRAEFASIRQKTLLTQPLTFSNDALEHVIAQRVIAQDNSKNFSNYLSGKNRQTEFQNMWVYQEPFLEPQSRYQPDHTEEIVIARPREKDDKSQNFSITVEPNTRYGSPVVYEGPITLLATLGFSKRRMEEKPESFVRALYQSDKIELGYPFLNAKGVIHIKVEEPSSDVEMVVLRERPYRANPHRSSTNLDAMIVSSEKEIEGNPLLQKHRHV